MNRQIKFRGKTLNGEYVFGNYHYSADNKFHYILNQEKFIYVDDEHILYLHPSEVHVVIPKSIGQFTGLHDKNGKEIFEGDVIKPLKVLNATLRQVIFLKGGFWAYRDDNDFYALDFYDGDSCEIIGNVFENPDLVKL